MQVTHKVIETDRVRLSYADSGGNGWPLLFQHGLCGAMGQTIEAFPDGTGARFLTLECRGHGLSELGDPDAISINTFADDVIALMDQLGIARAVLGGISMGAAIALQLAVQQPERVRALILARPAWLGEKSPENMLPNLVVGQLLLHYSQAEAKRQFLAGSTAEFLHTASPDNLASLSSFFEREPLAATSALLRAIAQDGPGVSRAQLAALQLPCLVIGHQADVIHPLELARNLATLIPHAQFVEITPKTVNRSSYLQDMHQAIQHFLKGIPHA